MPKELSCRGQGEPVSGFLGHWAVRSQQVGPLYGAAGKAARVYRSARPDGGNDLSSQQGVLADLGHRPHCPIGLGVRVADDL